MPRKQLIALFVSDLAPFAVANALLSLLPIYVRRLGVNSSATGFYLAIVFVSLVLGTLISGWLSGRFRRHKRFIIWANLLSAPAVLMMGQAENIVALTLFTCAVWFMGGIQITMVNILMGLHAGEGRRGRNFGVLGIAPVLAGLVGGLSAGPVVNHGGFAALFVTCALLYVLAVPMTLMLEERTAAPKSGRKAASPVTMSTGFMLLFAASALVSVANFVTGLSRPLLMDMLDFDPAAISSTVAVSSAFNLPLPFVMGWLSDRLGRKPVLVLCYLGVAMGVAALGMSTTIWHFWVSQILIGFVRSERVIGSALVTDAASWLGAVIGYAFSGMAIQTIGITVTLTIGMMLPLAAMLLVVSARPRQTALAV